MSAENVELVRGVYAEWAEGNMKAGRELLDPEIDFESFAPISNEKVVVRGPDGIEAWLRDFLAPVTGYRIIGETFTEVGDDKVLVEGHQTTVGRHSGIAVEGPLHSVSTFRDRKVVHLVWEVDRQKALEAAGLSE